MDTANGGHGSAMHDVFVPGRVRVVILAGLHGRNFLPIPIPLTKNIPLSYKFKKPAAALRAACGMSYAQRSAKVRMVLFMDHKDSGAPSLTRDAVRA